MDMHLHVVVGNGFALLDTRLQIRYDLRPGSDYAIRARHDVVVGIDTFDECRVVAQKGLDSLVF